MRSACVQLEQTGPFTCEIPLANDIYAVSVHTSRVCHQLGLWDGIKRDRLNWTSDLDVAGKADYVLWSGWSVLRRSLRELGSGTPCGHWMNAIDTSDGSARIWMRIQAISKKCGRVVEAPVGVEVLDSANMVCWLF